MLKELQSMEPRLQPVTVMVDFERAIIKAITKVFNGVTVKGCFFHMSQCIWKHIQQFGLQSAYARSGDYALNLRMLGALAFVPPADVEAAYEALIASPFYSDHAGEWEMLLSYIEATWIGTINRRKVRSAALFPVALWNHYDTTLEGGDRTNNIVEGWHNAFNNRAQAAHVTPWKFIDLMRDEQALTDLKLEQILRGDAQQIKNKKYRDRNRRLLNVVGTYGQGDVVDYLRGVAHNLAY